LLDAFFIGHVRSGLSESPFGITEQLSLDWPIFLAHVILLACLLPMAAIDLQYYWVDVRFTNLATLCGFVMHTLWTPRHSADWIRPGCTTAVMSLLALMGLGLTWLLIALLRATQDPEEDQHPPVTPESPEPAPDESEVSDLPPTMLAPSRMWAWMLGVFLVTLFVLLWIDESGQADLKHVGRALVPLIFLLGLIIREGMVSRPADQEIVDTIYEERFDARQMALTELVTLIPAIVACLLGWYLMNRAESISEIFSTILHVKVNVPGVSMMSNWRPIEGFATAASGFMLAGALGWGVRIFFTLLFGKEAFGMGDVHLMAAAGCVAGWPVVLLAFFLTCGLALLGWLIALPVKRSRALPLGPWLSLSFLIVIIFYNQMLTWPLIARVPETLNLLLSQKPQFPMLEGIR